MICPRCQTPNPDGALACRKCSGVLSTPAVFMASADDSGEHPTIVPPSAGPRVIITNVDEPERAPKRAAQGAPGPRARLPLPAESTVRAGESEHMQTIVPPSSFGEWARSQALYATPVSLLLPEGVEIGHRYRVTRLLGVGGMGSVYRVHDRELDRDVALKLIRAEIASDPATLDRFKREIQLSSKVTHPNVLRVFDLGEAEGVKYLTMEFVEGENLSAILKQGKLPVPRVLAIFRQICEGLRSAHQKGVIHRDLKPQNIMLDAKDHVYLTDFGLAKSVEQSGVTQTGAVVGTPYYMSPEQVKGETAGPQSDIYSLGVILYEMLTGSVPFSGKSVFEVMIARVQKQPEPVRQLCPEVPVYLANILDRCLTVDTRVRYATADEILADLDAGSFRPTLRYRVQRNRWIRPVAAGAFVLALLAGAGVWVYRRGRSAPPAAAAKTESVLVADFANRTGEPVFDGTLEPAFSLALEGASFVSAYSRPAARKVAAQLKPGATSLDETLARLVAVREGIQVVTSGAVDKHGSGYEVSVRAIDASTGKTIATDQQDANGKEAVLSSVVRLAAKVRRALGDATPESSQLAAAETYTAGSVEAAHEYAVAQELQWAGNWEEAVRHYRKALDLDPNLGRAYAGLAVVESNRGRRSDAEKYYKEALSRIDRMSDREKYRTRGGYYLLVRNPDNAIEEFTALTKQYPADTAGLANLAGAYFYKREMSRALQEGRRAIEPFPKNVPQRNNVGLYAMYGGDFPTAIRYQDDVLRLNPKFVLAYVGKALSQLALGQPDQATETYRQAAGIDARGGSLSALGLADIALYQGRPADAAPLLEKGIEADTANQNADAAAEKLAALAGARLQLKDPNGAVAAAEKAVSMARGENVLYPAALVFLATGREARALALASDLGGRLEPDPQAYAELIRGEAELVHGRPAEAIRHFQAAKKVIDSWAGRFALGRGYLAAKAFAEADTELETCVKRRGEATAMFLDESPSYRVFPPVYYYLGLAREGLKSPGAADAFKSYLAIKTGDGDVLAPDAKKRLGG